MVTQLWQEYWILDIDPILETSDHALSLSFTLLKCCVLSVYHITPWYFIPHTMGRLEVPLPYGIYFLTPYLVQTILLYSWCSKFHSSWLLFLFHGLDEPKFGSVSLSLNDLFSYSHNFFLTRSLIFLMTSTGPVIGSCPFLGIRITTEKCAGKMH